ncbi:MMPL family transporter [Streptomyces lichenis]|uniref:MMPL family transporter n=1 Tax=Streptomyces lichenis TaxID=2306967 RepID=A0ABT0I425_9ACTN|nr:MMPL family transporter [Streptomyces lichenis]MCK8676088.1 MMPL family transporter [Streptomyces lichenis]
MNREPRGPSPAPSPLPSPAPDARAGALRRARRTLVLAGVLCALFAAGAAGLYGRLASGGFAATGTEAAHAAELATRLGADRPDVILLLRPAAEGGAGKGTTVDGAAARAQGAALVARLAREPGVQRVRSPWAAGPGGDPGQHTGDGRQGGDPSLRTRDGRAALVLVHLAGDESDAARRAAELVPRHREAAGPLRVTATGPAWFSAQSTERSRADLLRAELLAAPLTFAVLAIAFRSLVAALLPVVVGGIATAGALAALHGVTFLAPVSVFGVNLAAALGFGLAVDYSLLMVSRYREERALGREPLAAVATTTRTAARTVAVSACTITAALAALLVFPFPFLRSMAYAGMAVAVLAAATAIAVIPAALLCLGPRAEALDPLRRFGRPARADAAEGSRAWAALARAVTRRPVLSLTASTLLLGLMLLPFASVRLSLTDHRNLPVSAESHRGAEAVARLFPQVSDRALTVVLPGLRTGTATAPALDRYGRMLSALHGAAAATTPTGRYEKGRRTSPALPLPASAASPAGTLATVVLTGPPSSEAAARVVRAVRALPAPGPAPVAVAGQAAATVDARRALTDRLPLAAALVALATLAVVGLHTRSVLVPVKVVLVAAVSLGAALGCVALVFQHGVFAPLTAGFAPTGALDTTIPVLVFCIAFGLAVDYELFLLSRIQEHYRATGDNTAAVVEGIARTGRVFTAAALAVAVSLGALIAAQVMPLRQLGFGIALAVLVDATVVRGVLVPATMRLLGRANWWLPFRRAEPVEPVGPPAAAPSRPETARV